MTNPEFIEEQALTLAETRSILKKISKRDEDEAGYRTNKTNEFLDHFVGLITLKKKDELAKKLVDLNLTRLKEEHIVKITDFLPATVDDLKIVLQAYPLSMPKKDQEAIVKVVKEFAPKP
jgi:DNA-directed RNA polymerase subunit F